MEYRWNTGKFCTKKLFFLDEIIIRERYLGKEIDISNLFIMKNFIRFLAAVNCGKIIALPIIDFINIYIECFFAGFIRIIEIPIFDKNRNEIYNINY
jgi:hypothetical protein